VYSKVVKTKKENKLVIQTESKKEIKGVAASEVVGKSGSVKTTNKAKSELNLDDLSQYQIDRCDLKAKEPCLKVLPTRVVNCTPRPFTPVPLSETTILPPYKPPTQTYGTGGNVYETIGDTISVTDNRAMDYKAEVVVTSSQTVKQTQQIQVEQPNKVQPKQQQQQQKHISVPVVARTAYESGVDKVATVHKSTVVQTNKEATVHKSECVQADPNNASGPISMSQLKEILSESQANNEVDVKNNILFDDCSQPLPNAEKEQEQEQEQEPDEQPKDEDENRSLVSRFRQLKDKTISEVTKITRGRSMHKGPTRSDTEGGEGDLPDRTRSESRSQKAGRLVKGITSNILKKR